MEYLRGFGNSFWTEAEQGAIPKDRHSPQRAPHGLYAEYTSGTAFTAPRAENRRTWLYRIRPSVTQGGHRPLEGHALFCPQASDRPQVLPEPLRWNPLDPGEVDGDWISATRRLLESDGVNIYLVQAGSQPKAKRYFQIQDGEMLFIAESGSLRIRTELGVLAVPPCSIGVVPPAIKFSLESDGPIRAYCVENLGAFFRLPELGPIGSNGLAYAEHFETPQAAFEDLSVNAELITKYDDRLWACTVTHSPFNVVGWQGNYAPYRYDLRKFQPIGTISFDHPDPSIFTVLTSPSNTPGVANCDFVIFPPRWLVGEDTFRPPWFHRNIRSEYMGLIEGIYDSKPGGGFVPGGGSLHNRWVPHGPDTAAYERGSQAELRPEKLSRTMAFMAETRWIYRPTAFAMQTVPQGGLLQTDYRDCWGGLKKHWPGKS